MRCCLSVVFLLGCSIGALSAQADRYELGRRLAAFERSWAQAGVEAKERALPFVDRAVKAYFSLQLTKVAAAIDEAGEALGGSDRDQVTRFVATLATRAERRLIDPKDRTLNVDVDRVYGNEALVEGLRVVLTIVSEDHGDVATSTSRNSTDDGRAEASHMSATAITTLPMRIALPIENVPLGDIVLVATYRIGDRTLGESRERLSSARDIDARLGRLEAFVAGRPDVKSHTEGATLVLRLEDLRALRDGKKRETDLPGAVFLTEAEALAAAATDSRPHASLLRSDETWLRLALDGGKRTSVVRVFTPRMTDTATPIPVVVALHGAGGSENLFFDGYGAGALVALCRERGWMLVAPRAGLFGAPPVAKILDAIAGMRAIDPQRAYLVGHSMGTMHATSCVKNTPDRFAAVALLSVAGVDADDLRRSPPLFIGSGVRDFSFDASERLAKSLTGVEGLSVTFRSYPRAEHLLTVQEALPDVATFFEKHMRTASK